MADTLKPCPFCGHPESIFIERDIQHSAYVECLGCSAHGPAKDHEPGAIAAWNTRTMADTLTPAMIEVREALTHARNTFYRYAKLHRAKCTDEGDEKACANAAMGEEMDRALEAMNAARTIDDAPDARLQGEAPDWLIRQLETRTEAEVMREAAHRFADEYLPSGLRETPEWRAVFGEDE